MKNAFYALLVLALLLGACSPADPPAPTQAATPFPSATPQATIAPATPMTLISEEDIQGLDGTEVIVWHVWRDAEGAAFEQLVADFNAADPFGVEIEVSAVYQGGISAMPRALTAGLNAGELPNIAVLMPYQYNAWRATGGRLAPLTDYTNDAIVGYPDGADFFPAMWQRDIVGDERWGVPAALSAQVLVDPRCFEPAGLADCV